MKLTRIPTAPANASPFDALFESAFRDFDRLFAGQSIGTHEPAADVLEGHDAYMIRLELPGATRDDLSINVEDGVLTIDQYCGDDRRSRTFRLSRTVDQSAITAALDAGILTVTLPRAEEAKARQIEIN
ncbi:Hsp20/alpha crystallin family protein [Sulfuriroseicoccus oceanibius]|uniref:Hsp20/alpha crystallin family protein n=1 Tax=Sulfuriroseicoccus oceanibius TaxID=2707525 RepID=A0A6B3LAX3_9BACT|nr:Hsp20/alpha crystallin family protein [Sulfuriroseicoccus oceanibius]QQL45341.1 Hsp20/alpha crystallin family protein [Sulfuriroseicoccus oceanibius]